jgi:hypothetical protein
MTQPKLAPFLLRLEKQSDAFIKLSNEFHATAKKAAEIGEALKKVKSPTVSREAILKAYQAACNKRSQLENECLMNGGSPSECPTVSYWEGKCHALAVLLS